MEVKKLIHRFSDTEKKIAKPERFTYPFYYTPHPLAITAVDHLKAYLSDSSIPHNFGLGENEDKLIIGKMFGVLVVEDKDGQLGHLWAFSGKLAESNIHPDFVPPIFDTLDPNGFYKKGEKQLNIFNKQIDELENDEVFIKAKIQLEQKLSAQNKEVEEAKSIFKKGRSERKSVRKHAMQHMSPSELNALHEQHKKESLSQQHQIKLLEYRRENETQSLRQDIHEFQQRIDNLKQRRRELSSSLQTQLHQSYSFLNAHGYRANLLNIFDSPPAGSGECAAPKLLQFAFQHSLKPITMAEFWWGTPPPSDVKVHGMFYPACRGKCLPILTHMLQGLEVDPNPMQEGLSIKAVDLDILYEDTYIVAINKPPELLSVPGKIDQISLLDLLKQKYPKASGPLLVHRLDMSTSGIILIALDKTIHKDLQRQFITRKVIKRYEAILDGKINNSSGIIKLPLRVDLDNRPYQIVCFDHGKNAETYYEVIETKENITHINFFPKTGRTHQLRVHAAHYQGLGCPILGDDLYGTKKDRLHLHAAELTFIHPVTKEKINIICPSTFSVELKA